ncbi:MAG: glycosyltransferase family 39 protein [Planctomycetota bacterium]|nr:glycosyltransferase family 39 protein [Planctomycetota bacterium]
MTSREGQIVSSRPDVSVIVPTLNERENIAPLVKALSDSFRKEQLSVEILIADGGSSDGTQVAVETCGSLGPARLIKCESHRGLAGDVLVASREARADVVVVMDADLSHPPEVAPKLAKAVLDGSSDIAIGSRFVRGGSTPGWPWTRRVISRVAGLFAWPLVDVADPTSGFFAARRSRVLTADPAAHGFKILLEVLLRDGDEPRTTEIPISFRDRERGKSKMSMGQVTSYLRRLLALSGGAVSMGNAGRFAVVGLLGLAVDVGFFQILWGLGLGLAFSHIASFFIATVFNYVLNSRWAFSSSNRASLGVAGYARFLVVCLLAMLLRGGVLGLLVERMRWTPSLAVMAAVFAVAVVNFLGLAYYVFPRGEGQSVGQHWRLAAVGLVAYMTALRLVYLGLPDLIPEEAYYWNYAQHPAMSYLDHPPMIAWLISLGTQLLGNTELGVRIGAFLCWLIAALFSFGLARDLFGKGTALRTVMLLAVLPFFAVVGFLATPDAPLTACWAGALFFLGRALLLDRRLAWWGVGICMGLGMLSKYTIASVGLATLVFVIIDSRSRRWLLRPEPYVGALVAAFLFLPVVLWNAQHEWASFVFQSIRRLNKDAGVSLDVLALWILLLLTPAGILCALAAVFHRTGIPRESEPGWTPANRRWLFGTVFVTVPLAIFAWFSLRHSPQLNWTGPLWLAILPAVAAQLSLKPGEASSRIVALGRLAWRPTVIIVPLIFGGFLHYISIGLPCVPYPDRMVFPVAWEEFGREVEQIEDSIEHESGREPLVVALDRYATASELAFYRRDGMEGVDRTTGDHLFGGKGLMYLLWFPPDREVGETLLVVSFERDRIADARFAGAVDKLGPIVERTVSKNGLPATRFYYRVCQGYRGTSRLPK